MPETGIPGKTSPSITKTPTPSAPRIASAVSPPQPSSVPTPPALTSCAIPSANRAPAARGSNARPSAATSRNTPPARPDRAGQTPSGAIVTVTAPDAARRSTWATVIGSWEPIASRIGAAAAAPVSTNAPGASRRASGRGQARGAHQQRRRPPERARQRRVEIGVACGVRDVELEAARGDRRRTSTGAATPVPVSRPSATTRPCAGIAGATSARLRPARAARTATSSATWPLRRESTFLNTISGSVADGVERRGDGSPRRRRAALARGRADAEDVRTLRERRRHVGGRRATTQRRPAPVSATALSSAPVRSSAMMRTRMANPGLLSAILQVKMSL